MELNTAPEQFVDGRLLDGDSAIVRRAES